MSRHYQAVERHPDRTVRLGEIDEDGDRVIWYRAGSEQEVLQHLARRGIEAEVHLLPPTCVPLPHELDFDLTAAQNDRSVTSHTCFRPFRLVEVGKALTMVCSTCGAVKPGDPPVEHDCAKHSQIAGSYPEQYGLGGGTNTVTTWRCTICGRLT